MVGKTTSRFPGEREWTLIALDDPGFWEGVADAAEWENYLAGGPEPKHWHRELRPVTMHPSHPVSPARLSLEQALGRLERVRRRGRSWSARCPAHPDRSPSLVVSESPDWAGYPVFFCYAGCTHQAVKDALLGLAEGTVTAGKSSATEPVGLSVAAQPAPSANPREAA